MTTAETIRAHLKGLREDFASDSVLWLGATGFEIQTDGEQLGMYPPEVGLLAMQAAAAVLERYADSLDAFMAEQVISTPSDPGSAE